MALGALLLDVLYHDAREIIEAYKVGFLVGMSPLFQYIAAVSIDVETRQAETFRCNFKCNSQNFIVNSSTNLGSYGYFCIPMCSAINKTGS